MKSQETIELGQDTSVNPKLTKEIKAIYRPEPIIELDYEIRFNPHLTSGEKILYGELKSICSRGRCPYNKVNLADLFGVSSMSISTWVKKLCLLNYIEVCSYPDGFGALFIKLKKKKAK